ncbi:hypothetical protein [Acidovorax sp. K2F]|uniref:hypothetical protein n=1 Tax=Acidovorax sp. K2F TaxID=2978125 RepID=UPI0021B0AAD5|nr:hypothetical protein [Acidovorax sp. K2F]MCT6720039.1 hypothetical protein [Acidovorax sp. K2F]
MEWTEPEIELVRQLLPTVSVKSLTKLLPGRSEKAIRNLVARLGLKRQVPMNWRPIGAERMNRGHLIRKVTDTGQPKKDWKRVEVIEWEAVNGPMPPGTHLMVKNPALPRTLDNLAPFSSREHWARVTVQSLPPELRQILQLKGQITQAINRRKKEEAQ